MKYPHRPCKNVKIICMDMIMIDYVWKVLERYDLHMVALDCNGLQHIRNISKFVIPSNTTIVNFDPR